MTPRRARVGARSRFVAVVACLAAMVGGLVLVASHPASAALSNGFVNVPISTDLGQYSLTNFVFLPSGDLLIIGKCGAMERIGSNGAVKAKLQSNGWVPCSGDRGLVGIALAPDYSTSRVAYLLYNYTDSGDGKIYGKLARWVVNAAASPTAITAQADILVGMPSFSTMQPPQFAECDSSHTVGTVLVAPDGTLFVGNGDASSYCTPDQQSLDAQDRTSPRGKIFHINPDGTGVSTNPFYDGSQPSSWQSRVFAYGLRNPFRFTVKHGTSSTLYIGDVGFDTYEEVDVAKGGENFGWPCYEGPSQSTFHPTAATPDFSTYPTCQSLYMNGTDAYGHAYTPPLTSWSHATVGGQSASIGGVFYTGGSYPVAYQGAYFYGDYASNHLWTLRTDANDALVRQPEATGFASGSDAESPVGFQIGPDGDIYWADIVTSTVYHLQNASAPIAVATADQMVGGAPLTVQFDGTKSGGPNAIVYSWDFGDGTAGSTAPKPVHAYTATGIFTARVTVTDTVTGSHATASVTINTTDHVPVVSASLSPPGLSYAVGDTVTVTASATDAEDGPIAPGSLTFQQFLHHCPAPGQCHVHPGEVVSGTNGTYSFTFPNHGDDIFIEVVVTARDSQGAVSTAAVDVNAATSVFTPVTPYRLVDTRATGAIGAGHELAVDLSNQPGEPASPSAVVLNVTATNPLAAGFVRAYPCGTSPSVSTVNFDAGQTAANLAAVAVPADRRVCFWSMTSTDLIVDVAGWYSPPSGAPAGAAYTTVDPVRVLDTRDAHLALGGVVAPFQAGQEYSFTLAGWSGFPADARAALLNLTVTNPAAAGYVRVYPCGAEQVVSNVNYVASQTVANLAAVQVAAGGRLCIRSYATTDLVIDLAGWYAPRGGLGFAASDPVRLFDTRDPATAPTGVAAPFAPGQEIPLKITGTRGVPAGARGVAVNVTATNPAAAGYVKVYPCGTSPLVSDVNYRAGQLAAANLAVVKVPADGRICFSSFERSDLVVDLAGWYVS